ncbi:MAG: FtsX-like permease family protein [Akkermansiaceae bacterium]|nr:FtsX-like permease family protein [Akkermansiaceae bacterium]
MRGAGYMAKLAWRMLWPQRSVLRVVALVCVLGIALGTMLQIVVRGVMDGMVAEIDAGVSACVPPLLVKSKGLLPEAIEKWPEVHACKRVSMGRGLVQGKEALYASWADLVGGHSMLIQGHPIRAEHEVLVSKVYAEKLQLRVGQQLLLITPGSGAAMLTVCGVFRVPGRMLVPDILGRASLPGGEELLAIELADGAARDVILERVCAADAAALAVDGSGGAGDWMVLIAKVKRAMGIILYSATLIASFAAGGLMLVIGLLHRRLMAVLYAFGVERARLFLVFLYQGMMVATPGAALGALLGMLVLRYRMQVQDVLRCWGLDAFPTDVLDMELPALAPPSLYITQVVLAWGTVVLASLPGAWVASRCRSLR